MPGVLIYKNALQNYYSYVIADDNLYNAAKTDILKDGSTKILWERENVTLEQIESARRTKDTLVSKLNRGEKVNLEKELEGFFIQNN